MRVSGRRITGGAAFVPVASVARVDHETPALDDDQERRARLLLLAKGAVLAHRLARPVAAESDEKRLPARRRGGYV
jgi:hypothetical protein